ncbi:MAG: SurA N-terminal domain-containing protein, partial [Pseudomonadota bacterium]
MFDFVTKHKRLLQIILALTLIPFAFFGIEHYARVTQGGNSVAMVDGVPVSQREFGDELRRQQERIRALFGAQADVSEIDTPEMRLAILESLIGQRLVLAAAADANLVMSKEQAIAAIMASPEFQEGGRFSAERYSAYLRSRGMSDEGNVERLRFEIPAGRLAGVVTQSAFMPRAVAERLLALEGQQREVSQALVRADAFAAQVKPDEAQVKAFYEANLAEYRSPERVRAEYVVLSAAAMQGAESVGEEELQKAYQERASRYAEPEQRRASHILVKTKEEADKLAGELRG